MNIVEDDDDVDDKDSKLEESAKELKHELDALIEKKLYKVRRYFEANLREFCESLKKDAQEDLIPIIAEKVLAFMVEKENDNKVVEYMCRIISKSYWDLRIKVEESIDKSKKLCLELVLANNNLIRNNEEIIFKNREVTIKNDRLLQELKDSEAKRLNELKIHSKPRISYINIPQNRRKKSMATLKAAKRNKLSDSKFGMPGSRKYPMPDKSHAANAKARATQMVAKGKLSPASASKIKAKANKVLGKKAK